MRSWQLRYLGLMFVMILLAGGMLACDIGGGGAPSKPTIIITAPTSGTEFQVGEKVSILSSASDAKGITRVELYVDGVLYRTDPSPVPGGTKELTMFQEWIAEDPGTHTISVIAVNVDGAESDPWAATIRVAGDAVSPSSSPTTEIGPPPTTEAGPPPTTEPGPPPAVTPTVEPPPPTATVPAPTPTPTVNPNAPVIKYFRANGQSGTYNANPGESVLLTWEWEGVVTEGRLDPGNVPLVCPDMPCSRVETPSATTTYTLRAINAGITTKATVTVKIG